MISMLWPLMLQAQCRTNVGDTRGGQPFLRVISYCPAGTCDGRPKNPAWSLGVKARVWTGLCGQEHEGNNNPGRQQDQQHKPQPMGGPVATSYPLANVTQEYSGEWPGMSTKEARIAGSRALIRALLTLP